ncbi:MAG: MFS transporter [Atopobiaceae bacterium]|nr:MFS transporter [Atopobiaceae bacterium]
MNVLARRAVQLIVGTMVMLCTGAIYAWSVFVPALQEAFGWNASQTSLVFTFTILFLNIGSFLGGNLVRRLGVHTVIAVGAVLLLSGIAGSSFTTSQAYLVMTFGVLTGTGCGFVYNMLLSTVAKWFPDRSGFCSGALLLGFGMGGMVFGTLVGQLVSSLGWSATFLVIGIPIAAISGLAALVIRAPREEEETQLPAAKGKGGVSEGVSFTTAQMLRSSQFWIFVARVLLMIAAGLAIVGNATPLATEVGAPSELAVLLASAISMTNGFGRIIFGVVFDRMGRRFTLAFDAAVFLGAIVLLYLAGLAHSVPIMAVSFLVLGLSYGGIASCNAAYILGTFGPANYASNFGAFNLANMFASPISQVIGGSMAVRLGSYTATFPILVGVTGTGLVLSLLLKERVDVPAKA